MREVLLVGINWSLHSSAAAKTEASRETGHFQAIITLDEIGLDTVSSL